MNGASLNLGLIGAGPWGRNYIDTIRALDGVALTRLASRNPESAALAGPDCEITGDWRKMLAAGDLDGVIIATPPALHAEMTLAAIDRGVAVLVEKPMTLNLAEAEIVLERAQSQGAPPAPRRPGHGPGPTAQGPRGCMVVVLKICGKPFLKQGGFYIKFMRNIINIRYSRRFLFISQYICNIII